MTVDKKIRVTESKVLGTGTSMHPWLPANNPNFRKEQVLWVLEYLDDRKTTRLLVGENFGPIDENWDVGTHHALYDIKGREIGLFIVVGIVRFFTMDSVGRVPDRKKPLWIKL